MEIFRSLSRGFLASFSGVLDWIVLILVWFERSLHFAQVSEESCPWPLKLMTSQRVERTWIRTGGYGRFRGEWVKQNKKEMQRRYLYLIKFWRLRSKGLYKATRVPIYFWQWRHCFLFDKCVSNKVDCKTVGFFLKISKEIGNAWHKSLMRANRASLTRP